MTIKITTIGWWGAYPSANEDFAALYPYNPEKAKKLLAEAGI